VIKNQYCASIGVAPGSIVWPSGDSYQIRGIPGSRCA